MKGDPEVGALILAAGIGSRMGKTKQTLLLGNKPILEHVIHRVLGGGFSEIIAVIGYHAGIIQQLIPCSDPRFQWVINKAYRHGQSTSLQKGIQSLKHSTVHVMVYLGDLPFLKRTTMHHIYETGLEKAKHIKEPFIVRPCYEKTLGHPVFFGHVEKQLFLQVTGDHGAKQMMNLIDHHIHVPVDDKGVILDIDTVDDYRSALKRIQTNQGLNH